MSWKWVGSPRSYQGTQDVVTSISLKFSLQVDFVFVGDAKIPVNDVLGIEKKASLKIR